MVTLSEMEPAVEPSVTDEVQRGGTQAAGDVIVVTGGAGFLGQHIIKLLHEKMTNIKEIRVFDLQPYEKKLDYKDQCEVTSYVGDIRDFKDVEDALSGATAVIHTASLVSVGTSPNVKAMNDININGTKNVIKACVSQSVTRLVYTSTVDVMVGYGDVINGDETRPLPVEHIFQGYARSKAEAERLVLDADGATLMKDVGSELRCVAVRPPAMYGEEDRTFLPKVMRVARSLRGTCPRVGNPSSKMEFAYVGNVAWGHLVALEAMSRDSRVSGNAYIITDDTPLKNIYDHMDHFMQLKSLRVSKQWLPFLLVYWTLWLFEVFVCIVRPLITIDIAPTSYSHYYVCLSTYFDRSKAAAILNYQPLYTADEALKYSDKYYKVVKL